MLSTIAARAPTWVSWNFDHSGIYGQKRLSKLGAEEPLDLGAGQAYSSLRDHDDWTFLVFAGVRPMGWKRFSPSPRTKSDPLPRDEDQELSSAFARAVQSLDVDKAIALVRRLGARVGDFEVSMAFDDAYPIEWPETAEGVARIGSAIADVRPLPAWAWVRLLEVAAVMDDAELRARAERGLSGSDAVERAQAIEEAATRFAARSSKVAAKRFTEWTGAKPRRRGGR